ncbi:MAG: ABC transporter permease [Bacteroidota bacterium]
MNDSPNASPPTFFLRLLRWFCREELIEDVEGDLLELYDQRHGQGSNKAKLFFARDVLLMFRPGIVRNIQFFNSINNNAMIKNYLKIAVRNALRYKGYTVINLLGLTVGLVSSILILLWVQDEVNVNSFHENGNRTYQIWRNMYQTNGDVNTTAYIPQPAQDVLETQYPEIEHLAVLSWNMEVKFEREGNILMERGLYGTKGLFQVFSFPWVKGTEETALSDLSSIAISERFAEKLFGRDWQTLNPVGKSILMDEDNEMIISGVFKNIPDNSTISFDWVIPHETLMKGYSSLRSWDSGSIRMFFTLNNNLDQSKVAERMEQIINEHSEDGVDERLMLQKFEDTYLYSKIERGVITGGRIDYVRIMIAVAIFILLIACINFMNLVTARSGRRSKEIGVRKVMGAGRSSISIQFFVESLLLSYAAMILSVVIVITLLPYFNILVDKSLMLDFSSGSTWLILFALATTIGLFSGFYPAMLLPTYKTITALKGVVKHGTKSVFFRKGLVVFQFGISMLLIIGTFVIYQQMQYILNKDLGLDKENLVMIEVNGGRETASKYEVFKNELLKLPQVQSVTGATGNPIDYGRSTGSAEWDGKDPSTNAEIGVILVNDNFVETMKIELLDGRSLSRDFGLDTTNYMINEVAAKLIGYDDPVNRNLSIWNRPGKIVGLIKDFHMADMYESIAPLIIGYMPEDSRVALIRIKGDTKEALESIEKVTVALNPGEPFRFELMADTYVENYQSEFTVSKLSNIFTVISVFISCLGLFALSAFSAEQRSKEIGVRKVHGAENMQIVLLLSKDYARLMVIAIILAVPFGYYYADEWLANFEYRTTLSPFIFIMAGVVAFIIGSLTVSFKSFQAAAVNPVKSLKDE